MNLIFTARLTTTKNKDFLKSLFSAMFSPLRCHFFQAMLQNVPARELPLGNSVVLWNSLQETAMRL